MGCGSVVFIPYESGRGLGGRRIRFLQYFEETAPADFADKSLGSVCLGGVQTTMWTIV